MFSNDFNNDFLKSVRKMTKDEMTAALDAMLEQGNQLRASDLVPVLKAIVEALPSE